MFPVYSVTYVPGPYPVLRSLALLDVLLRTPALRGESPPGRALRFVPNLACLIGFSLKKIRNIQSGRIFDLFDDRDNRTGQAFHQLRNPAAVSAIHNG